MNVLDKTTEDADDDNEEDDIPDDTQAEDEEDVAGANKKACLPGLHVHS